MVSVGNKPACLTVRDGSRALSCVRSHQTKRAGSLSMSRDPKRTATVSPPIALRPAPRAEESWSEAGGPYGPKSLGGPQSRSRQTTDRTRGIGVAPWLPLEVGSPVCKPVFRYRHPPPGGPRRAWATPDHEVARGRHAAPRIPTSSWELADSGGSSGRRAARTRRSFCGAIAIRIRRRGRGRPLRLSGCWPGRPAGPSCAHLFLLAPLLDCRLGLDTRCLGRGRGLQFGDFLHREGPVQKPRVPMCGDRFEVGGCLFCRRHLTRRGCGAVPCGGLRPRTAGTHRPVRP